MGIQWKLLELKFNSGPPYNISAFFSFPQRGTGKLSSSAVLLNGRRQRTARPDFWWRGRVEGQESGASSGQAGSFWCLVLRRRSRGCSLYFPHAFPLKAFWSWATKVTSPSQREPGEFLRYQMGPGFWKRQASLAFSLRFPSSVLTSLLSSDDLIFWLGSEQVRFGKSQNGCSDQDELPLSSDAKVIFRPVKHSHEGAKPQTVITCMSRARRSRAIPPAPKTKPSACLLPRSLLLWLFSFPFLHCSPSPSIMACFQEASSRATASESGPWTQPEQSPAPSPPLQTHRWRFAGAILLGWNGCRQGVQGLESVRANQTPSSARACAGLEGSRQLLQPSWRPHWNSPSQRRSQLLISLWWLCPKPESLRGS